MVWKFLSLRDGQVGVRTFQNSPKYPVASKRGRQKVFAKRKLQMNLVFEAGEARESCLGVQDT